MKSLLSLCFFVTLTLLARCHNFAGVFIGGRVYFIDADCYSRMTRVRMVLERPFTIIKHHDFENYPQGITSHATAPFDYFIAFCAMLLRPFSANSLDLAGALVSPLIGVAMVVFLWFWSNRAQLKYREMLLLLFAISPILVHGTILGRPDHQSLQMLCVAVALGAEWCFFQKPSRGWGIASGAAWGLAIWTSTYEPLILLAATASLYLIFDRRKLFVPERKAGYLIFASTIALALATQGWPFSAPDAAFLRYFPQWERTVGELSSTSLLSPLIYRWVGFCLPAMPVLFILRRSEDRRSIPLMLFVATVLALCLWQARWGYFFALVFAMTIPFQFAIFRKPWIAWTIFCIGLWPVLKEWDETLFPREERAAQIFEERKDGVLLRDAAAQLKSGESLPVLAPWWFSPALVYWSGQPSVAGSSHESLPGIIDAARFYMTSDDDEAQKILRDRRVKRIVAYDPSRVLSTSSALLGLPAPQNSLAMILFTRPHSAPPFLKLSYDNFTFKIFDVELGNPVQ